MHNLVARALVFLALFAPWASAWEEEYRGCIKACSFRLPGEKWDDAKRDWAKACREACEEKLPQDVRAQRAERMEKAKAGQAHKKGTPAAPPHAAAPGVPGRPGPGAPHAGAAPPAKPFSPIRIPANTFKAAPKPAAADSRDWTKHHLECIKQCMPERRMGEVWDAAKKAQAKACQDSCADRIPEHVRLERAQRMKQAGVPLQPAAGKPPPQAAQPGAWSDHRVSQDSPGWRKSHLDCIRACMPEARKGEMWGESERTKAKLCRESCSAQLPEQAKPHLMAPQLAGTVPHLQRNPFGASSGEDDTWKRQHQDCIKACMPVTKTGQALDAAQRGQAKACQESCNEKIPQEQRAKAKKMRQDPRLARQMQDSIRKSTHRFMENMAPADVAPSAPGAPGARGPPGAWVKRHSECITACMPPKESGRLWDEGERAQAKVCRESCEEYIPLEVKAERAKQLENAGVADDADTMEL